LLQDEVDIEAWNNSIQLLNKSQLLEAYRMEMNDYVARARIATNRSMLASEFDLIHSLLKTPTGNYGTITYRFLWTGFAKVENDKILIGDVFFEGIVLPVDSILIIKIPEGYESIEARPKSDKIEGEQIIWIGTAYREFGAGEPALVLMEKTIGYTWLAIIAILLIAITIAVLKRDDLKLLISRYRFREAMPETDEALILKLLIESSSGEMYQSEIVKKSGFSKSKVSLLLESLKQKEKIVKIRKGKENLIRLKK
jgi:hypothetical protein